MKNNNTLITHTTLSVPLKTESGIQPDPFQINQKAEQLELRRQARHLLRTIKKADKENEALKENQHYSKTLINSNPHPFTSIGLDGLIKDTNLAMMKATGLSRRDIVGTPFRDLFSPAEKANNLIYMTQRDHKITKYALRIKNADGKSSKVQLSATLNKNKEGKTIGILSTAQDITQITALTEELSDLKETMRNWIDMRAEEQSDSGQHLTQCEDKFKLLYSMMDQGMAVCSVLCDESGKPLDYVFDEVNLSFSKKLRLSQDKLIGKHLSQILPNIEQVWLNEFDNVFLSGQASSIEAYLAITKRFYSVHSYKHSDTQIAVIVTDITQRLQSDKRLLYLNEHDTLTGLYNRRFFHEALLRMDKEQNLPFSMIMGDVNGLKLINDAYGHSVGDDLLIKIADVFRKVSRTQDVIARLGGDEFMILLPKTDMEETKALLQEIKLLLADPTDSKIAVSVSFGFETKNHMDENTEDLIIKTENHLYRHKLTESTSLLSIGVDLIMKTFLEKNLREAQHSRRVSELSEALAIKMGLKPDEVSQARLAGLMHDIGKIGINESILNLNRSLTAPEILEIRKHAEIGHRILNASSQFSEIAQDVLQHHEHFDGNGYPNGLKGNEISMIARIISIADAYDAMSSDRPYRKAFETPIILKILTENAGTQFDPAMIPLFIDLLKQQ